MLRICDGERTKKLSQMISIPGFQREYQINATNYEIYKKSTSLYIIYLYLRVCEGKYKIKN